MTESSGDAAANTSTVYSMDVGDTFEGTLNPVGEHDWIRLDLDPNESVTISLGGQATGGGTLSDPFLSLRDATGTEVAFNDDFNGLDSQLDFSTSTGGTFYIDVGSYADAYGGTYTVEVTDNAPPPPGTFDPLDGIDWGTTLSSNTIDVYFGVAGFTGDGYTSEGFNAYEIQQFQAAFDIIEAAVDLQFNIVTNPNQADFQLVLDTNEAGPGGFLGFFNPPSTGPSSGVGVFNGAAWDRTAGGDLEVGGFGFDTIVHELGHGLGLAHPHDTGGSSSVFPNVVDEFSDTGDYDLNQGVYTMMSYIDGFAAGPVGTAATTNAYGYQASFMGLDLGVLHDKYGANMSTNLGGTSYVLPNTNAAGTFWSSIWDAGGNDTISHTGSTDATIDLRAATLLSEVGGGGFLSAVDGIQGGFSIANGAEIENASGGSGDDLLQGNSLNNELLGNDGTDTLNGEHGADTLNGGNDNDEINAGAGNDLIVDGGLGDSDGVDTVDAGAGNDTVEAGFFRSSEDFAGGLGDDLLDTSIDTTTDLAVDLAGGTLTGGGATAAISGFEHVSTGAGNNAITGSDENNLIQSGGGADTVNGGEGTDTILGGGGNDSLDGAPAGFTVADSIDGGNGNDTITGADQNRNNGGDTLLGGAGEDAINGNKGTDSIDGGDDNDTINGGTGDDSAYGSDGDDSILGAGGNDLLDGGIGADILNAGAGADDVTGGADDDTITGGNLNDTMNGDGGRDLIRAGNGNDTLDGGVAGDRLLGGFGSDLVRGGNGNDDVRGEAGFDTLNGGAGNDTLRGGDQNDTFVFEDGFGNDLIVDFDALRAGEKIDLAAVSAITDFADLAANHMTQSGARVIIDDGAGNTIQLNATLLADLDAGDFIF